MTAIHRLTARLEVLLIAALVSRLLPALAVALVAAAHELDHASAAREAHRRRIH